MEPIITIDNTGIAKILINKNIYKLDIVFKAAYLYIDDYYIFLDCDEKDKEEIVVYFKCKSDKKNFSLMRKDMKEFINELLHQTIRKKVMKETKNIREMILGRALYSACIEYEESFDEENGECLDYGYKFDIDDVDSIGIDWFEKNEGED